MGQIAGRQLQGEMGRIPRVSVFGVCCPEYGDPRRVAPEPRAGLSVPGSAWDEINPRLRLVEPPAYFLMLVESATRKVSR